MSAPKQKPTSFFVQQFEALAPSLYKCRHCQKIVKTSKDTRTNLNRHVKKSHTQLYNRHVAQKEGQRSAVHGQVPAPGQLAGFVKRRNPAMMNTDSEEYQSITNCLAQMIGSAYQSLALVEDRHFRKFVEALNPAYPVPGRRYVRHQLLSLAEEKKTALREKIAMLPDDTAVCVTMDLWSSRRLASFLGMTVHFVAAEPGKQVKLEAHLLAFKCFPERPKAANITLAYEEVVEDFNLHGKISVLVTDSAANMLPAFKFGLTLVPSAGADSTDDEDSCDEEAMTHDNDDELEAVQLESLLEGGQLLLPTRLSCAAHTLQLVVKDGLKGNGVATMAKSLHRLNGFVAVARKSTRAMEVLAKHDANLLTANATRWNSQLAAVSSFIDLPPTALANLKKIPQLVARCPEGKDRAILRDVTQVLTPFAVATDVFQGENIVTSSHVVPTIMGLHNALRETQPTSPSVVMLAAALEESLMRRFGDTLQDPRYMSATMLDPRFKLAPWSGDVSGSMPAQVKAACLTWLRDQLKQRPCVEPTTSRGEARPQPEPEFLFKLMPVTSDVTIDFLTSDEDDVALLPSPPSPTPSTSRATPSPCRSYSSSGVNPSPRSYPTPTPPPSKPSAWQAKRASLYAFMRGARPTDSKGEQPTLLAELDRYLGEPMELDECDPIAYWAGRRKAFPQLEVCARNLLSIAARSALSERIFSESGRMCTPLRSRMGADLFEALMHVNC